MFYGKHIESLRLFLDGFPSASFVVDIVKLLFAYLSGADPYTKLQLIVFAFQ